VKKGHENFPGPGEDPTKFDPNPDYPALRDRFYENSISAKNFSDKFRQMLGQNSTQKQNICFLNPSFMDFLIIYFMEGGLKELLKGHNYKLKFDQIWFNK
jgi:hypothetical protein